MNTRITPEQRIAELGLEMPSVHGVFANYANVVASGRLAFVSGHGPFKGAKPIYTGRVGRELTALEGRHACEITILNMLGSLRAELGDLSRVQRVVRLLVMVNSDPGFTDQHLVADGATDLLEKIFGEHGRPTRAAIGVCGLPFNIAVEIEGVFEVAPSSQLP